jgi:hypothetical protein
MVLIFVAAIAAEYVWRKLQARKLVKGEKTIEISKFKGKTFFSMKNHGNM